MTHASIETKPANKQRGALALFGLVGIFIGAGGAWGFAVGLFAIGSAIFIATIVDDVAERITRIKIED